MNAVLPALNAPQTESISLYYREGNSDKVYQCAIEAAGERFVVNFAYGRRGSTMNTGTKTNVPVDYDTAKNTYDKLIREKKAKGYSEGEEGTPYQHSDKQVSGIQCQLLNPISEEQVSQLINDDNWCMQEKFDGRRLLLKKQRNEITGINRKGLVMGIPNTLIESARTIPYNFVIDGECMGERLVVFDLLDYDGRDCRPLPYAKRLVELINLLASGMAPHLSFVQTLYSRQGKAILLTELSQRKAEGAVFKRLDAPYTAGRPNSGGAQLKHKFYASLSAVVTKINQQRSVEVKLLHEDGWHSAGNVTIPPNQNVPAKGAVIELRYLYAFKESGVLYQPTYLGTRIDISPTECLASQLKFKGEDDEG